MSAAVDMSPAAIEARLARASELSPLGFEPLPRVDMTPAATERRLAECAELSRTCRELGE